MTDLIRIIGNLGRDPEVSITKTGKTVCKLSVAASPPARKGDNGEWVDGQTTWWNVTCWEELADAVADRLHKGDRVTVYGRPSAHGYNVMADDQPRASLDLTAVEVAVIIKGERRPTNRVEAIAQSLGVKQGGFDSYEGEPPF